MFRSLSRTLSVSAALALASACGAAGWQGDVAVLGTTREVLRDGKTQARADLAALRGDPTLYAVGALENLEGEYTIDGGDLWTSRARNGEVATERGDAAHGGAAMVLSARVKEWSDVPVTKDVDPSEFEDFIRDSAAAAGLDPRRALPFIIDGGLIHLESHVIAGDCPMRARMLGRAVDPPPFSGSRSSAAGRIIGFYAERREGEMTHHGVRFHGHVVLDDERPVTAHVESTGIAKGATLRLPVR